jgi:hypothetical protein
MYSIRHWLVLVVSQNDADKCLEILKDEKPIIIGKVK